MASLEKRLGKESFADELSAEPSSNDESMWKDSMIPGLIDRVENWIRTKLAWDDRDYCDRRQIATDIVYEADVYRQAHSPIWTVRDMTAMCSKLTDRKIIDAIRKSRCKKNSVLLTFFGDETIYESVGVSKCESHADWEAEFSESFEHIWNLLNDDQKRVAELLTRDNKTTINDIAKDLGISISKVRRIRDSAISIACSFLDIRKEPRNQETKEPRNQGTKESLAEPLIAAIDYFEIFPKWFGEVGIIFD